MICTNGKNQRERRENGLFAYPDFSHKVAGIIAVKRNESLPLSRYNKLLFINERFKDKLEQLRLVMDFDQIIFFNECIHA